MFDHRGEQPGSPSWIMTRHRNVSGCLAKDDIKRNEQLLTKLLALSYGVKTHLGPPLKTLNAERKSPYRPYVSPSAARGSYVTLVSVGIGPSGLSGLLGISENAGGPLSHNRPTVSAFPNAFRPMSAGQAAVLRGPASRPETACLLGRESVVICPRSEQHTPPEPAKAFGRH